ncbi:hypothetical protein DFS34DRAFT_605534 [Phlyctochytrium arcticum]|nr:hypothetical protein DFS34DRAFT_605534 [Phlyctochytrium arcticum]
MPAGSQLPPEIISQIVDLHVPRDEVDRQTLAALCLVSRAWKDIAQTRLWPREAVLNRNAAKQLEAFCSSLAANPRLGRLIKTFKQNGCKIESSNPFETVASLLPNLEQVELCAFPFNDQNLYELAEHSDKLAELTLIECPNITEDGWIRAAPFLKKLRVLILEKCLDFRDKAVRVVVDSCPLLERLDLYDTDLTCDGVRYIMLNAPELADLSIESNQRIEERGMQDILSQRPARLRLYVWVNDGPSILVQPTETS